jgi:FtsH-binding integral membrane protein
VPEDDRPLFEKPLDELLPPDPPKQRFSVSFSDTRRRVYDRPEAELVAIARLQKQLLGLIVLYLAAAVVFVAVAVFMRLTLQDGSELGRAIGVMALFAVVIWGLELIVLYRLARQLHPESAVIILLISFFVRCAGGILLLVLNWEASSILKRNGIRVGLFGARTADLPTVKKRETKMPKLGW